MVFCFVLNAVIYSLLLMNLTISNVFLFHFMSLFCVHIYRLHAEHRQTTTFE